jgi:hypothetical protein
VAGAPRRDAAGVAFHLESWAAMPVQPRSGSDDEPARDVLAAEAFAVPAPDPGLRPGPMVLPEDPTGIAEPHDVLAAEEFAMPAAGPPASGGGGRLAPSAETGRRVAAAAALGGLLALLRLRRRGR